LFEQDLVSNNAVGTLLVAEVQNTSPIIALNSAPSVSSPIQQPAQSNWLDSVRIRFAMPSPDMIAASRVALLEARDRLSEKLMDSPEGMVIATELELDSYEKACENPVLERLDILILKSRTNGNKLVQPLVDSTRQSLHDFRAKCLLTLDPTAASRFSSSVELLSNALQSPVDAPLENYYEISQAYEFLSETRLIDDLLQPIQQQFSHANQRLDFTQGLVNRMVDREIKQPVNINKTEQGMQISGKGTFVANPTATFVPDPDKATVQIHIDGLANTNTVGQKSPATIFAKSTVRLVGDMSVNLNQLSLEAKKPTISATSRTKLTGLSLQFKCRMLNQLLNPIASKIVQKKLTESDPKLAATARTEALSQIEEYRDDLIVRVNGMIQGLLWQSFDARDIKSNLKSQTTSNALTWTAEFVGPNQLGALKPAPAFPSETELAVQFHESTFNNTNVSVAGRRINEAVFMEMMYDQFKFVRDSKDEDPASTRIPASFTFADLHPLQLRFDDGVIRGQIRVKAFSLDLTNYMDTKRTIHFTYKPSLTADGFTLDRQGAIELDAGDADSTDALKETMQRFLKPQFVSGKIQGTLSMASLKVGGISIDNGWLSAFLVSKQ